MHLGQRPRAIRITLEPKSSSGSAHSYSHEKVWGWLVGPVTMLYSEMAFVERSSSKYIRNT